MIGEIEGTRKVQTSFAVPLYVLKEWNERVPKQHRSKTITAMMKKKLYLPLSKEEERLC